MRGCVVERLGAILDTKIASRADSTAYLDALNPDQRRAVGHGADPRQGPLLVIAGASPGKTNTLAHRVAHLILNGADPRRILLLTFSRRAAAEMARRVERISRKVLGDKAGTMTDALTWAGTFHGVGARLVREYAHEIGLDPAFSVHDREDSADLMDLVRHDLGFAKTERRFPIKGTTFRATSTRRRRSSRWSATTARRSRSSPPPMPSSTSPASASPRPCGASGPQPTSRA